MRNSISSWLLSVAAVALLAGTAHAQQAGAPEPPAAAAPSPAVKPAQPMPAQPMPPPAAGSAAFATRCLSEIRSDTEWKEQLRNQLRKIVGIPEIAPPGGGHQSVMREGCNALMRSDIKFRDIVRDKILLPDVRAQLSDVIRIELHTTDAARMLRNKRHVIYTYSFLWMCMAGFVVFMWVRQRKLGQEIERLRHDLDRAAGE